MNSRLLSLAVVALAGLVHGCGDSEPGGTAAPKADHTVIVKNYTFEPKTLNVKPGQTVEWVVQQGSHDVVSGTKAGDICTEDGKFKSALLSGSSNTYRFKFETAGSYPYFCSPHCTNDQTGTVVVAP
jgi:plastocyanin